MRRKDKEVTDKHIIEDIIRKASVCRIGMSYDKVPYVVPVSFGYSDSTFYFHSANEGKKLEILKLNPKICIEISNDYELRESDNPCNFGMRYRSVIAMARTEFIENEAEKREAVEIIVKQYSDRDFSIPDSALKNITVVKARVNKITCKISGY